jgi:hypothetical protein
MTRWLVMLLCGAGMAIAMAIAADPAKVAVAVAEWDAHVAKLRAEFARAPAAPDDKAWIRSRLRHLVAVDQYARLPFTRDGSERGFTPEENTAFQKEIGRRMEEIDTANTAELKKLIEKHGWFRISEFGPEADNDAWLLVQHADRDPEFQRATLRLLEPLAAIDETDRSRFAYLVDRVALSFSDPANRKLQRYGTQLRCTGKGQSEPWPVEDPDNLDQRRREVGLQPMAEYQKSFKDLCHDAQSP